MKLLEPLIINGMRVPNRVVVPAMVTRLCGDDGFVSDAISDRYVRYAQGGVGLIVVEAMAIHGSNAGPLLRIGDDKFIPGLRAMNQRIHDVSDSKVVPQLIHFLKISKSGWRQTVDMLTDTPRFGPAKPASTVSSCTTRTPTPSRPSLLRSTHGPMLMAAPPWRADCT